MTSRNSYILYLAVGLFVAGVGACSPEQTSNNGIVVDTLFTGGDIVTMNDAQPVAEAVAVLDGTKNTGTGLLRRSRALFRISVTRRVAEHCVAASRTRPLDH
jgi:hypothetical protein